MPPCRSRRRRTRGGTSAVSRSRRTPCSLLSCRTMRDPSSTAHLFSPGAEEHPTPTSEQRVVACCASGSCGARDFLSGAQHDESDCAERGRGWCRRRRFASSLAALRTAAAAAGRSHWAVRDESDRGLSHHVQRVRSHGLAGRAVALRRRRSRRGRDSPGSQRVGYTMSDDHALGEGRETRRILETFTGAEARSAGEGSARTRTVGKQKA